MQIFITIMCSTGIISTLLQEARSMKRDIPSLIATLILLGAWVTAIVFVWKI